MFALCSSNIVFSSRRRHTSSDRDWSSDVCSSDLHRRQERDDEDQRGESLRRSVQHELRVQGIGREGGRGENREKIGRASCRERVYISELAGSLKKKINWI